MREMSPHRDPPGRADGDGHGSRPRRKKPPRDLIDFYRRWSEFRETAIAVTRRTKLSSADRETVRWLILLADRIGEHDIGALDKK
jgi:hypothetical protein